MPEKYNRSSYLRAGTQIDQRVTAACLDRIADWLDLSDSRTPTTVYPELPDTQDKVELAHAWMWAALLIADTTEPVSEVLHMMATGIRQAYEDHG
jgi:hypothetical protein